MPPNNPRRDELMRVWKDWSGGIGYLHDDGETNGMYFAKGLLGLSNELRPAPHMFASSQTLYTAHRIGTDAVERNLLGVEIPSNTGFQVTVGADGDNTSVLATNTEAAAISTGQSLLVGIVCSDGVAPDTVTWNTTESLTSILEVGGSTTDVSFWYLSNPTVGAFNIVATWGGAVDSTLVWAALTQTNTAAAQNPTNFSFSQQASSKVVSVSLTLATNSLFVALSGDFATGTVVAGPDETEIFSAGTGTNDTVFSWKIKDTGFTPQYWFEEPASATQPYMYAVMGKPSGTYYRVMKIDTENGDFGEGLGDHSVSLARAGQPARHEGFWRLPAGGTTLPRKLTVGTGDVDDDTLSAPVTGTFGDDHLANINYQLMGSLSDQGIRLLKVGGDPEVDADWGQHFPVGDKSERATGLASVAGASFALLLDGLYSFNEFGRSALVFDDLKLWRAAFENQALTPWRGGMVTPHASGLLFYELGQLPINIGFDYKISSLGIPPSGPTEFHSGKWHGLCPMGDYLYAIYQPDRSSTTAYILCAYASQEGRPTGAVTWQCLGSMTLINVDFMHGIGVATIGFPRSSSYRTPTLWVGDSGVPSYIELDNRAGPFKSRSETHRVTASAEMYLPEMFFPDNMLLTDLVVYTQDMVDGDQWDFSLICNAGDDLEIGKPIIGNGRHVINLNRTAYRTMIHIGWVTTVTSARVPPSIRRIELYGRPVDGI